MVRDFVATVLWATDHAGFVDDARLCASEVVSNAYRHTRSPRVRVEVSVVRRQVTVSVTDDEPGRLPSGDAGPEAGAESGVAEGGRGLVLVNGLATRWGATEHGARSPHSKTVWFTLAAD
ncbi:ATP-binding protein [Streptomyces sp. NPDC006971]|uniref:ATP-binding protein n=1 Tax=Streptomyces sp. NPDC006971 TaxID=3154784 RepID=UPI00340D25A2